MKKLTLHLRRLKNGQIFKKYFPKGHVVLSPGGPKASDPIFLDLSNIGDIKVKKEY